MINQIKELWKKKKEPKGRIDITVFFVNLFLVMCHIFLMAVYLIIGQNVMIYINIGSIILYVLFIPFCYKNVEFYLGIAFLEIWIHQMCGILSFGWTPCYQNWCFGMLTAFFIPAFNKENKPVRRSPFFAFLIILSYFILATTYPLLHLSISMELSLELNSVLFIFNNSVTFIAIALFALFYTKSSKRKELELTRKADYDELTGMYNRYSLNQLSEGIIEEAKKNNKSYSVAILDLDHFKQVNDTYGHVSGDDVLKKFALILKAFSKKGIISGRWGGEEFVMMASSEVSYKEFLKTLNNLRTRIEKTIFPIEDDKTINVTVSIGAAEIKDYKSLEKAILEADANLYKAKEKGRNRVISN